MRTRWISGLVSISLIGATGVSASAQTPKAVPLLTPNQIAANGPLPGDVTLYGKELACAKNLATPGYFSSINGAEIADAQRSGLFPCATFTGSFNGNNRVLAWRSEEVYQATTYINNRKPGEIYITGGEVPPPQGVIPAGPFVAKADATTGRQLWRTYLDNGNASGAWIANANLNILADGRIALAWADRVVLLDGDTGLILKSAVLPTGNSPRGDVNFKHLTIARDGTLILKDQTRPKGCPLQGTMAIIICTQKGLKQPNSRLVALNPNTLEVLAQADLPEPSTVPHIITMFEGKIAIYVGVDTGALRYFWDPRTKKLTRDESWEARPQKPGQTTSDAPSILGDWIVLQTNGLVSKTASSIVAVHQKDPKRVSIVFPFGNLAPGQISWAPPKPQTDPENSMIYSADVGVGKVAGIKLNQKTGDLKVAWVENIMTTGFQPLIGPKNRRVILLSNMKADVAGTPVMDLFAKGSYSEQVTWRDAATGRLIAESDYFEPMTIGSLITPAFGGRVYFPTGKGFLTLQVLPKLGE